jgi:hypothetical protein
MNGMGEYARLIEPPPRSRTPNQPLVVTAIYSAIAIAMTWPLALHLGRDVPGDLGDPVLNCWILGSNAQHLLRFIAGDWGALRAMWSPRIFYPEPLALAYSEHLLPQTLTILPLYAATGNLILCYNLLFLSTFVLSALGAFMLVRDLTNDARAGFLAGVVFGFAPYRVGEMPHLQVLSSQWMPCVFWGLLGYFRGQARNQGRACLVVAAGALLIQNLSCGYYLLYFTPFAALYVLWQLAQLREPWVVKRWLPLVVAAVSVGLLTVPFVIPYLEIRRAGGLVRSLPEVANSSADVYSYLTAPVELRLWGDLLQVFPKNEGALFPSFTAALLVAVAAVGAVTGWWRAVRPATQRVTGPTAPPTGESHRGTLRRWLVIAAGILGGIYLLALLASFASVGDTIPGLRLVSVRRPLHVIMICSAVILLLSPRVRAFVRKAFRSPSFFALLATLLAVSLSLGPWPTSLGRPVFPAGPYLWLYQHVPGFDGLRVPARMAMIVMLFLALLAGRGLLELLHRRPRPWLLPAICLAFLVESTAAPLTLNDVWKDPALRPPPRRLLTGAETPAIYREVWSLPTEVVLVELPFGSPTYELRYMLYALRHGRALLNGYSGAAPPSYLRNQPLATPLQDPDRAWAALARSGATHAIVHETAWWRPGLGHRVSVWLESHGARRLASVQSDVLFALPAPSPAPPTTQPLAPGQ